MIPDGIDQEPVLTGEVMSDAESEPLRNLSESALRSTPSDIDGGDIMTEPDDLSTKIRELMDWQTVAWRRVADPDVTTFERREIRNHVKTCNDELRRCLAMKAERLRARGAGEVRGRAAELNFRLLVT
jgi:hypothetical protein